MLGSLPYWGEGVCFQSIPTNPTNEPQAKNAPHKSFADSSTMIDTDVGGSVIESISV